MKQQLFALVLVSAGLLAASVAHAAPVTEARSPGGFHGVDLKGALEVDVQVGPTQKVEVTADADIISKITTVVKDGKLLLGTPDQMNNKRVRVVITAPKIDALNLSGAGTLRAKGLSASNLALSISGAGDMDVNGTADTVAVEMSGAGSIRGKDLASKSITVDVSGTGSATLTATEALTASLSGVGSIDVYGHPKSVTKHVNGMGSIHLH